MVFTAYNVPTKPVGAPSRVVMYTGNATASTMYPKAIGTFSTVSVRNGRLSNTARYPPRVTVAVRATDLCGMEPMITAASTNAPLVPSTII